MAIQQGWNQLTAAARHTIAKSLGKVARSGARRRRGKKSAAPRVSKRRVGRVKLKSRHLVAGSAAAKAWGRKMKRARKK